MSTAEKINKQGFTLLEIVISLAITAVAGVFLMGFLSPQIRLFNKASDQESAKAACAGAINVIQEKIRNGKDFSLSGSVLTYTEVTEDGEIGGLSIDGASFGDAQYPNLGQNGMSMSVSFVIKVRTVEVSVTVTDQSTGGQLYTLSQSIGCPNMEL